MKSAWIFSLIALLCASTAHAEDVHLRIGGFLTGGLEPELKLVLKSSNFLCMGSTKIVNISPTIDSGTYKIKAVWDSGFCGYFSGSATLTIDRGPEESVSFEALIGESQDGYVEFHEVDSIRCGDDPDLGSFTCMPLHGVNSIIGNRFYFDPVGTGLQYHLDIFAE